ncbi:MAG: hypothetical protein FWD80_05130 [Propionibacteriaceae bacterium]|nr:hypothetical protein [Propionibacteriaceae bacterium]
MAVRSMPVIVATIALVAAMLTGCTRQSPVTFTSSDSTPTVTTPTMPQNPLIANDPPVQAAMQDLVLPTLPSIDVNPITVNLGDDPEDLGSMQNLADDVVAGNIGKIATSCWTQPSSDVRAVYGSPDMRGAILDALQQTPQTYQAGASWTGQYVTVSAYWEDLSSPYPCPSVQWSNDTTGLGDFTPALAHWRITRILAVQNGNPVHLGDGPNYSLICDDDCIGLWTPHATDASFSDDNVVPILTATNDQWNRLRLLSGANITVDRLTNGYYRVSAADGSTDAIAYFSGTYSAFWLPYTLGEID